MIVNKTAACFRKTHSVLLNGRGKRLCKYHRIGRSLQERRVYSQISELSIFNSLKNK